MLAFFSFELISSSSWLWSYSAASFSLLKNSAEFVQGPLLFAEHMEKSWSLCQAHASPFPSIQTECAFFAEYSSAALNSSMSFKLGCDGLPLLFVLVRDAFSRAVFWNGKSRLATIQ